MDEFIFRYYPTSEDVWSAYQQGEVEGIGDVHESILERVLLTPDLAIYTAREPVLNIAYLNLDNPEVNFLQNPDLRRAMLSAINRSAIIKQAFNGQAILANGPIMPGTWAYYDDLEKVNYDPVEARTLFNATGVNKDEENDIFLTEAGLEVSLSLMHPDTLQHEAMAALIEADWEALGIEVTLDPRPYEEVLEALASRAYETALVEINLTRSPDPDPYPFWGQAQIKSGQNYADWDNRSASEFLEQARMTVNFAERERLYRNFQVLFMRELPSLPLIYPVYTYAISNDINGVKLGPIFEPGDRFNNVHEWYILSERETSPTETLEEAFDGTLSPED